MGLKDFLKKRTEKQAQFKEGLEEARMQKKIQERMKSAEERELEDFMEKERQKQIKMELEKFRQRERGSMLKGNLMQKGNIFKGHKQILKAPNIFKMEKANMGGNMFFK